MSVWNTYQALKWKKNKTWIISISDFLFQPCLSPLTWSPQTRLKMWVLELYASHYFLSPLLILYKLRAFVSWCKFLSVHSPYHLVWSRFLVGLSGSSLGGAGQLSKSNRDRIEPVKTQMRAHLIFVYNKIFSIFFLKSLRNIVLIDPSWFVYFVNN